MPLKFNRERGVVGIEVTSWRDLETLVDMCGAVPGLADMLTEQVMDEAHAHMAGLGQLFTIHQVLKDVDIPEEPGAIGKLFSDWIGAITTLYTNQVQEERAHANTSEDNSTDTRAKTTENSEDAPFIKTAGQHYKQWC